MAEARTPPVPDPALVEQVLAALDAGVPADPMAMARAVRAAEPELRMALAAVATYHAHLAAERSQRGSASAPPDGEFPPGTRLGEFRIQGVLGRGAMGVVYRARQMSLGEREVALKVLPAALVARDPRFVERFRREAALAAALHHPHVAEVYGSSEADGTLCFAMRLVEGRTLHDLLATGAEARSPAPVATGHVRHAVRLARDLASALAAIHGLGLVHRDVKPANVMLEAGTSAPDEPLSARPVLVDFGLLRPSGPSDLTGSGTLLGTPAYAAPESQLGRDIDARADVFSLGALLHDLLTGTAPGDRPPASAGLPDLRRLHPAFDMRLAAIVAMALQEQPGLRYADGRAFQQDLDRYLRHEPVRALPTSTWGRWRLWTRRNPVTAVKLGAALGVLALVLAAALGWFALTAGALMSAAAAGARLERSGDLRGAALALRRLHDNRTTVAWIPWLRDDLTRAGRYWNEDSPLAEVVRLLASEETLQLAHDRLHERLFDDANPNDEGLALAFLTREVQPDMPAQHRLRALETWADYLLLKPGPNAVTGRIRPLLFRIVRGDDALAEDDRAVEFAISALGGMPDCVVFDVLVAQIGPDAVHGPVTPQAGERARLALFGADRVWQLLHSRARSGGPMPGNEAMASWLRAAWNSVERFAAASEDLQLKHVRANLATEATWQVAWRLQELAPAEQAKGLPALTDDQGAALRFAQEVFSGVPGASPPRPDSVPFDPLGRIAFASADALARRAVYEGTACTYSAYDRKVWQPPGAAPSMEIAPSISGLRMARVDFQADRPQLQGDRAERATWLHGVEESEAGRRFLTLTHPGDSKVTLTTRVPEGAPRATITLWHQKAARWPLSGAGRVTLSIRIPEIGLRLDRETTSNCRDWAFDLDWTEFTGRDRLTVEVLLLRANTTCRIESLEVVWHP